MIRGLDRLGGLQDAAASGRRLDGDLRCDLTRAVLTAGGSRNRPRPERPPGRRPGTAGAARPRPARRSRALIFLEVNATTPHAPGKLGVDVFRHPR